MLAVLRSDASDREAAKSGGHTSLYYTIFFGGWCTGSESFPTPRQVPLCLPILANLFFVRYLYFSLPVFTVTVWGRERFGCCVRRVQVLLECFPFPEICRTVFLPVNNTCF